MRVYITLFFIIFLLFIAFIFGSQNEQIFTLNYLVAKTELTVASAVSIFTGIGIVIGLLLSLLGRFLNLFKKKKVSLQTKA